MTTATRRHHDAGEAMTLFRALGISHPIVDVLRVLREGPATCSQIARGVGYTRNGLQRHLDALEAIGAIECQTERVAGSFRPARRYRIDRVRMEEIAWRLFDALTDHDFADIDGVL